MSSTTSLKTIEALPSLFARYSIPEELAELFLERQTSNCFTLLAPNLNRAVEDKKGKPKEYHDEGRVKFREFKLNELVLVRKWRGGIEKWIPGRISQVKGPCTYLVRCGNQIRFVHVDHLKGTGCNPSRGFGGWR